MPDIGALMKQAQRLQGDVAKAQEEVALMTSEGQAGGGMVSVTVNGNFDIVKIKLDKAVVDPSDIAMLEDLVTAAVNAANTRMREVTKAHMSKVMGGMNIPGMPGMPF
jgi:DNA-binding YbaB/EbfC family protein